MPPQQRRRLSEADTLKRRQRLLEMRRDKTPWQQIVDELGYAGIGPACTDYKRVIEGLRKDVALTRDEHVHEELEHLEMLTRKALDIMTREHTKWVGGEDGHEQPDYGPALQAIEALRRLSERRSKLLGTDAPTRVEADGELRVVVEGIDVEGLK